MSEVDVRIPRPVYPSNGRLEMLRCRSGVDPVPRNVGKVALNASLAWLCGDEHIGFCLIPLDFRQYRTDTSPNTPAPLRPHCGTAYLGQVFLCLLPTFVGHCGGRHE